MKSGAIGAREERTSAYIKRQGAAVFIVRVSVGRSGGLSNSVEISVRPPGPYRQLGRASGGERNRIRTQVCRRVTDWFGNRQVHCVTHFSKLCHVP